MISPATSAGQGDFRSEADQIEWGGLCRFDYYTAVFQGADDPFLALRYFELHLLSLTGFQPQLHFCVACGEALEPVENYFHLVDGGTLCPQHGEARPNAEPLPLPILKVLRYLQTRQELGIKKGQGPITSN